MITRLLASYRAAPPDLRRRLRRILAVLLGLNVLVWLAALAWARSYPVLLGLTALAYGFGLRHAVDPDHIAAIDNTTRKLMQSGKRPVAVGFFFSVGHSTVVVVLSLLVALSASFVRHNLPSLQATGSVIGTSVSCAFLLIIGTINLVVLADIVRMWRRVVSGGDYADAALEEYLASRGLLVRLFRPLLRTVSESWKMYPVGFLFGLGFDTASEVGLLSISAATGASGMSIWSVMILPLAFTAGMALVDTLDGILMLGAYGWAFVRPVRKLYYNMSITMISVVIALFIGCVEGLQVISQQTGASGGVWALANRLQLADLGFVIVGTLAGCWVLSMLVYRLRGYDALDGAVSIPVARADVD